MYRRVAWKTCQVSNTTARSALCCLASANGCHPGWQPQQLRQSLGCHRCSSGTCHDKPVFLRRQGFRKQEKPWSPSSMQDPCPSLQQREGIVRVEILQKRPVSPVSKTTARAQPRLWYYLLWLLLSWDSTSKTDSESSALARSKKLAHHFLRSCASQMIACETLYLTIRHAGSSNCKRHFLEKSSVAAVMNSSMSEQGP